MFCKRIVYFCRKNKRALMTCIHSLSDLSRPLHISSLPSYRPLPTSDLFVPLPVTSISDLYRPWLTVSLSLNSIDLNLQSASLWPLSTLTYEQPLWPQSTLTCIQPHSDLYRALPPASLYLNLYQPFPTTCLFMTSFWPPWPAFVWPLLAFIWNLLYSPGSVWPPPECWG